MQRVADESRQVRKEATAVSPSVCRGKPGPLLFNRRLPFIWAGVLVCAQKKKGCYSHPFVPKETASAQSEWMLDLLTAIAASLKDSLTVG